MTKDEKNKVLEAAAKRGKSAVHTGFGAGSNRKDDAVYTPEEEDFLRAMQSYKTEYRRPNPTCCEVLAVLKTLGYAKWESS